MFNRNLKSRVVRLPVAAIAITVAWAATGQIINNQQGGLARSNNGDLLRIDLRAHRAEIVDESMHLGDAESKVFVPLYIEYDAEVQNLWNERLKLIAQYASQYDGISDTQASALATANLDLDNDLLKLRKKYYKKFEDAIGGRAAARFFQVDRRMNNLLELQAAQSIPLVE